MEDPLNQYDPLMLIDHDRPRDDSKKWHIVLTIAALTVVCALPVMWFFSSISRALHYNNVVVSPTTMLTVPIPSLQHPDTIMVSPSPQSPSSSNLESDKAGDQYNGEVVHNEVTKVQHDAMMKAIDVDKDGWSNYDDNCLSIANSTQADADGDGIGDACDAV